MSAPQQFELGDVLNVISGLLVLPRGRLGALELCSHMLGYEIAPTGLKLALSACTPALKAQFPHLVSIQAPHDPSMLAEWFEGLKAEHGEMLWVRTCP